jgi:hypothetical protein
MSKPTIRILLSEAASLALTESGERAFTVLCKASHPDHPGRWVIHLAPVEWKTACDASSVLLGTHTARKIKPAATPAPATTTGSPPNTP